MSRYSLLTALTLCGCHTAEPATPVARWQLAPELSIGGADSGPNSFGDLRAFAIGPHNRVYVLDGQAQEVRVFDSTGAFLRSLGRAGAGPGEFRAANGIAVGADGRLWVYDPGNRRVTIFDPSGSVEHSYLIQVASYGYVWEGGIDPQDRFYHPTDLIRGDSTAPAVIRFDLARSTADTFWLPRCEASTPPPYLFPRGGMPVPYSSDAYLRMVPQGYVWCGDTKSAEVQQYSLGDTVPTRRFGVTVEPASVTPTEREAAIARVVAFMKKAGPGTPNYSLIPATKPVLVRVDLDDKGNRWLLAQTVEGQRGFILDSLGALRAEVALPFRPTSWWPTIIRKDRLYVVTQDTLGLQSITRFRIQ